MDLDPQAFEDYKSKYLDIYDRVKSSEDGETVSIVDEIDFELELIQRDEINVAYILSLLNQANKDAARGNKSESDKKRDAVLSLLGNEPQLRSKRELIEKFIRDHMPALGNGDTVEQAFAAYWASEKEKAIGGLCEEEGLERDAIDLIIKDYRFTGREPLPEDVVAAMIEKPRILERRRKVRRVAEKAVAFVHQFEEGIGAV
ncbi:type I restriction endonuclease subunit R, EcoR124 family [Hyphomonas sp. UBA4508]|uniref:type I restriction endonuclease subunit R, EcoR124 family n=1 Tax=Hyphomonas sp. UBA4508 TaxID=1946633 RepID=UPI0025BBAEEB|nr:hypothetical protein [Hyphomonas sp. UBA4508]